MLGNLVPTPRVPRHLGILHGAVIRLPYLIVTIGRSYRRSSGHATHTVPKRATFVQVTLASSPLWVKVVSLGYLLFI